MIPYDMLKAKLTRYRVVFLRSAAKYNRFGYCVDLATAAFFNDM